MFCCHFFDADLNASLPSTPSVSSPTPSVISTDDAACAGSSGNEVFSLADQDISVAGDREQLNPQATKASFNKVYGKLRNLRKIVKRHDTEIQQRRASERKSSEDFENLQEEFENLQEDIESLETELRATQKKLTSEHQWVYYHRCKSDGAGLDTTAVRSTLASLRTISEKRAALRAQLLFRKVVLQQEAPSATFQLSRVGKQLPIEDLLTNLRSLLSESSLALSVGSTTIETRPERSLTELEIEPPSKQGPVEN